MSFGEMKSNGVEEAKQNSKTTLTLDLRKAHWVKAHITSQGTIKLLWSGEERNRFAHIGVTVG